MRFKKLLNEALWSVAWITSNALWLLAIKVLIVLKVQLALHLADCVQIAAAFLRAQIMPVAWKRPPHGRHLIIDGAQRIDWSSWAADGRCDSFWWLHASTWVTSYDSESRVKLIKTNSSKKLFLHSLIHPLLLLADELNEFVAVNPIFFNNLGRMHLVVKFFGLRFANLVAKITLFILCRIETILMLLQTSFSV